MAQHELREQQYPYIEPPLPIHQSLAHHRLIYFRHPAYPFTAPPLLRLPERCDEPPDGILRDAEYYFFVTEYENENEHEYRYPVIPSFDHWRFPHENIPEPWSRLTSTLLIDTATNSRLNQLRQWNSQVKFRDRSCRITGYEEGCEVAHLVPREKGNWFLDNSMERYSSPMSSPAGAFNDATNALLLRSDLHKLFDRHSFVLVPKGSKLVVHQMLAIPAREIHHLYHNRAVQPETCGIAPQFLLVRFAWTVFCDKIYTFLKSPRQFAITVWSLDKSETIVTTMGGTDITAIGRIFSTPATSRNVSPRKRKQDEGVEEEEEGQEDDDDAYSYKSEDTEDTTSDTEENSRGRSRTRRDQAGDVDMQGLHFWAREGGNANNSLSTVSGISPQTPTRQDPPQHLSIDGNTKYIAKDPIAMDFPARKRQQVG